MSTKRTIQQEKEQLDFCEQRIEMALARAKTAEARASVEAFRAWYAKKKQTPVNKELN